jgi:putative hydroxymethylpyrimidine transport system permease protein
MLHANARLQIDLMFAALIVLMAIALTLYLLVDRALVRLMPWAPPTLSPTTPE